jgi:hypothetical protein
MDLPQKDIILGECRNQYKIWYLLTMPCAHIAFKQNTLMSYAYSLMQCFILCVGRGEFKGYKNLYQYCVH